MDGVLEYQTKHYFFIFYFPFKKKFCIRMFRAINSLSEVIGKHCLVDLCLLKVITCCVNKSLESITVFRHIRLYYAGISQRMTPFSLCNK